MLQVSYHINSASASAKTKTKTKTKGRATVELIFYSLNTCISTSSAHPTTQIHLFLPSLCSCLLANIDTDTDLHSIVSHSL